MATPVAGLILAGGQSRRMGGGDKPLLSVAGQSLLERVIQRLRPQASPLLLNANGNPERFSQFGLPVRADVIAGYGGPLVGILTGLLWAKEIGAEHVITVAADTPLFPQDLGARLIQAAAEHHCDIALARSGDFTHQTFALWPVRLADDLHKAVAAEDMRKVKAFLARYAVTEVEWPCTPFDPFLNVNTPEDMESLHDLLIPPSTQS